MSVLSFPRIFFQGFMCWDIPTGNNNDQFPTYAYDKAELNWGYLKQFGITPSNFRTTFLPWCTSEQKYPNGVSPPGEWNFFGTNGCYFVQYENVADGIVRKSRITGGASAYKTPVSQDTLFGKPIALIGDMFGSPENPRPARLVDNNPASSYSSQIYFNSMSFGDAQTGFSGPCYRRMHSRFIGTLRNPNLPSAGHVSVTWQTCFPKDGLVINAGASTLLLNLQKMIASGQAKGIMVRFNTYLNLYFQNGYFNGSPKKPHVLADQPAIYKEGLATGNQLVNPCYSRVLGVIGPWYDDELVSVPEGRFLATSGAPLPLKSSAAAHPVHLTAAVIKGGPPSELAAPVAVAGPNINVPPAQPTGVVQLGVTFAEIDYTNGVISLDTLNTFPELFWQGDKVDLGTVTLAVQDGQGNSTTIATLAYADYNTNSYETNGGIIDIKFDPGPNGPAQKIKDGTLIVTAVAGSPPTVFKALVEKPWSANTDDRGIYLNEKGSTTFDVAVFFKGKRASNAKLMIAKYAPALTSDPNSYVGAPVLAIASTAPQIVNVTNGQTSTVSTGGSPSIKTNVTVVDVDANGVAHVNIQAASAGLPVLMFYPFQAGAAQPQPQQQFDGDVPSGVSFYTTIRVLSFDDAFVDQFIKVWNSPPAPAKPYDPALAWNFVYNNILYLYDMIYPVMLRFVPLGDRQRVEAAIDQVLALIAPSYFAESTLAMPITRDLSEGKRMVLQLWGGLVKKNYPPQPISKPSPPVA
jgi:hypothetical protein